MIKMTDLLAAFEELNFKNVKTYIQSGNVIFQDKGTDTAALEKKISKKIKERFGFDVPVLVIPKDKLEHVAKNNPFVNKRKEDISKLHVTFLSSEPASDLADKIKNGEYGVDEYIFSGDVVYLFCPDGYGRTKLTNNFFESKLKLTATTRNWKTVNELVKMTEI